MQPERQQTCQGCCGYPFIVVPETRQAFVRSLQTTPINKCSAFSSPVKKSQIGTLKSTSAGRDTSPGRTPPSIDDIYFKRQQSPKLQDLEMHIDKKKSQCNLLRQKYRLKEQGHRVKLDKLRKDFITLANDYRSKMNVLNRIESTIVNWEKHRARMPNRYFSVVSHTRK